MVRTGDVAPDFKLSNSQGNALSLCGILQKSSPLLVVFYKNECPTCQFTFPFLTKIASKLGPDHFLAVAQDSIKEAADFKKKYGFNFEVLSDVRPYPVSVQYGLDFVPTLFVIEGDKRISLIAEGFDKKAIEDFSKRVASLKQVSNFEAFDPAVQVPLLKPG